MTVVFNPSLAKTDASYRAEALKLYQEGKLEISDSDLKWLKEITAESKDDNQYDIEDDNLPQKDLSKDKKRTLFNLFGSSAGLAASSAAGLAAGSAVGGGVMGQMAGINAASPIACITAFVIGTKYMIQRPNKDLHDELITLQEAMETGNLDTVNAQYQINDAQENITSITDNTNDIQKDANSELEAKQKELEEKQKRLEELRQKSETSEGLTESEKSEFKALGEQIPALKAEIETLQSNTKVIIQDNQDEISGNQEIIEEAKVTFETVDDVAKYAESFDEATLKLTQMEAVAQGVNAALGTAAALSLTFHSPALALTVFGQVYRAMAIAGAGFSAFGMGEQIKFSKDIKEEIDVRNNLQNESSNLNGLTVGAEADLNAGIENGNNIIDELETTPNIEVEPSTTPPETPVTPPETEATPPEKDGEEKKPKEDE